MQQQIRIIYNLNIFGLAQIKSAFLCYLANNYFTYLLFNKVHGNLD